MNKAILVTGIDGLVGRSSGAAPIGGLTGDCISTANHSLAPGTSVVSGECDVNPPYDVWILQ